MVRPWFARGLQVGMLIIGTTIGAGFASGKEIWEFFTLYGEKSWFGIILAQSLLIMAAMIILELSRLYQTESYMDLIVQLVPPLFVKMIDRLILLYLFMVTVVMIAGSGAIGITWGLKSWFGIGMMAVFTILILQFQIEGFLAINLYLIPLLMIVILAIAFQAWNQPQEPFSFQVSALPSWPSAITYAALNLVPLFAILSAFGKRIEQRKEIYLAGVIAGFGLTVLALLLNQLLLKYASMVAGAEIPLLALLSKPSGFILALVSLLLWLAMYTSAVGNLYGMISRIQLWVNRSDLYLGMPLVCLMLPFASWGFSSLVEYAYPIYGVLNLFLLAVLFLHGLQAFSQKS